jgi:citrate synthase
MSGRLEKILSKIRESPGNVRFIDLYKVCEHYFGKPRQQGTGHRIYKTPWAGDPRINIQNSCGKAKNYQVKQVLSAIDRLESIDEPAK